MKIIEQQPHAKGGLLCNLEVNIHVESVSEISESAADGIITSFAGVKYVNKHGTPTPKRKTYLSYPLGVAVEVNIVNGNSIGKILWQLAQAYKEIYVDPDKYGVWGHGMRDLYFENIRIYNNQVIEVSIGS